MVIFLSYVSLQVYQRVLITNNITDDWELVDFSWLLLIVVGYSMNK